MFSDQVPFSTWLQDDTDEFGPLFWITGRPGSGKSTLMRFALEDRRTLELLPESTGDPVAYFFHLRGKSTTQKSLNGMLKELLYQLLCLFPHFYEHIGPVYRRRVMMLDPREWDTDGLMEGLMQIPQMISKSKTLRDRIFLFIDALDENEKRRDNETLVGLFKRLSRDYIQTKTHNTPLLKICLASRSWPLFESELGNNPQIPSFAIHNYTTEDIESYAATLLAEPLQNLHLYPTQQDDYLQLAAEIMKRANGVFVWVRVVVENSRRHIIDGTSVNVLRSKVLEYPEELEQLYEYTVKRIPEDYLEELQVALKVVYSSHTALSLRELYAITQICIVHAGQEFPASQNPIAWLASRSGGLIEEIAVHVPSNTESNQQQLDTTPRVQFIHQTVQDYVRTGIKGFPRVKNEEDQPGHFFIALALLSNNPPHPILSLLAEDTFSYLRECENDWDEAGDTGRSRTQEHLLSLTNRMLQSQWLLYKSARGDVGVLGTVRTYLKLEQRRELIKLLAALQNRNFDMETIDNFRKEGARQNCSISSSINMLRSTTVEETMPICSDEPIVPPRSKTPGLLRQGAVAKARLRMAVLAVMILNRTDHAAFINLILVSQNLYYPQVIGDYCSEEILIMAALGRRLADYRTDRPRMLAKLLRNPLPGAHTGGVVLPRALVVEPSSNIIWTPSTSSLAVITTAAPSSEITDRIMRHMAGILLAARYYGNGFDTVAMHTKPITYIALLSFCARFKGQASEAWVQELLQHKNTLRNWTIGKYERALLSTMGATLAQEESIDNDEEMRDVRESLMFASLKSALPGIRPRYILQGCMDSAKR